MATLKREQIDGRRYRDLAEAQAQAEIGAFIDTVYNFDRLHSALGYRSPMQFEAWHKDVLRQGVGDAARYGGSAPPTPKSPLETARPAITLQIVSP